MASYLPCSPPEQITEIVCILVLKLTFCGPFIYLLSLLCSTFDSNNLLICLLEVLSKSYLERSTIKITWNGALISLFFIRYEDVFNRFVDEINTLAAYQWWEGSIYSIVCILAYPLAWSWQQWRRRKKLQRLRELVRSEYDHSCLRALYEGLKVWLGFIENSNPFSLGHSHNLFMCI